MQLLIVGLVVGAVMGANRKKLVKPVAKGLMAVEEVTRDWMVTMREELRDGIEEARYEREQEAAQREQQAQQEAEQDVTQAADENRSAKHTTAASSVKATAKRSRPQRRSKVDA